MVAYEIMSSLKERLESRKISSDECDTFGEVVACTIIKLNYSGKELMEHETKLFVVSTGMYAVPSRTQCFLVCVDKICFFP
jgi:hypothetical protein